MSTLKGRNRRARNLEALGADIGGVVAQSLSLPNSPTLHGDNYLLVKPVSGAFATLQTLHMERFPGRVYLISKAEPAIRQRILHWLIHYGFCEVTGIPLDRVKFTDTLEGKADIARQLRLTHFIDDRLQALTAMPQCVQLLHFASEAPNHPGLDDTPSTILRVTSWLQVRNLLLDNSHGRTKQG